MLSSSGVDTVGHDWQQFTCFLGAKLAYKNPLLLQKACQFDSFWTFEDLPRALLAFKIVARDCTQQLA